MDYNAWKDVVNDHSEFIKVVCNTLRESTNEVLIDGDSSKFGRKQIVRPEKNIITQINDLVRRISKPEQLVLDPFAGRLSTDKACLVVEKNSCFVGYNKDA